MIQPVLRGLVAGMLHRAVGVACACAGRSWVVALHRDLPGVTVRAEVRSR